MASIRRRNGWFILVLAVTLYVLMSVAIAISTVDKCGDEDDPKHWKFIPPSWECENPNPFAQ